MRFTQLVERTLAPLTECRQCTERLRHMLKESKFPVSDEVRVLKYMRLEKGLSLRTAGRLLNITDGAISHIENGKMRLPAVRIEQMVEVYGFTMSEFLILSRTKKVPNNRLEECQRILTTIPKSRLTEVYEFLKSIKCGGQ